LTKILSKRRKGLEEKNGLKKKTMEEKKAVTDVSHLYRGASILSPPLRQGIPCGRGCFSGGGDRYGHPLTKKRLSRKYARGMRIEWPGYSGCYRDMIGGVTTQVDRLQAFSKAG
jgi:hypothetical protein